MAESARTAEMYRGGLNHEEDSMPQSLSETYNAGRSQDTPELSDPEDISYDMDAIEDAFEAYEGMETAEYRQQQLLDDQDALEAFGELFQEN